MLKNIQINLQYNMKKIPSLYIKYEKLFNYPFMQQGAKGYKLFTNQEYKLYELYIDTTSIFFGYIIFLGSLDENHYMIASFDKTTFNLKNTYCPSKEFMRKMGLKLYDKEDKNSIIDLLFNKMERFYSH